MPLLLVRSGRTSLWHLHHGQTRWRRSSYGGFFSHHPGDAGLQAQHALLDGRGSCVCTGAQACCKRSRSTCALPVRADASLRSHRFCRRADRLHPCLWNRPCFPFTNGWPRLPQRSWPSLAATACLIAPPCLADLSALDQNVVEALRTHFQEEVLARRLFPSPGGLADRTGERWVVIDVDGTKARCAPAGTTADGRVACTPSPV